MMGTKGEIYNSESEYIETLRRRSFVPNGFRFGVAKSSFSPSELGPKGPKLEINLATIMAPFPTRSWAAVLTRNRVSGAPIEIIRERLGLPIRGVLINNRVANVAAGDGVAAAKRLMDKAGASLKVPGEELLPASTGVIGWELPVDSLGAAMPILATSIGKTSPVEVGKAIMTTDAYPKLRSATTTAGYRILGIAKGAGMIEPNLSTMLVFIITDAPLRPKETQYELGRAVEQSFNRISVDGDQSTSDMVILISSSQDTVEKGRITGFRTALEKVCSELSGDIVRNGEGTRHVIEIIITSTLRESDAVSLGKSVGNSPLVKTAIYGNDPNVGRIASAVGDHLGNNPQFSNIGAQDFSISLGDHQVFADGVFLINRQLEADLTNYLNACDCDSSRGFPTNNRVVRIGIEIAPDCGPLEQSNKVRLLASDLGYEYVRENASYRS